MAPTVEKVARTDAGLAAELRTAVMRLRRRLLRERDPDLELGAGALSVLGVLFRNGEMTVGRLAEHERVKPPSMTKTVGCLVEDGYVERRADEQDKRVVRVDLTDLGRETVLNDRRRRDAWLSRSLRGLSAEERDVLREALPLLHRLAETE